MAFQTRPKSKSKSREPPPSLFLHPSPGASPGASHVSLPGILAPPTSTPVTNNLKRENSLQGSISSLRHGPTGQLDGTKGAHTLRSSGAARGADRTDALWAEMQATLEEVELSASGGTHVFGPDHDAKLADLRAAQIALAQAWARSEADSGIDIGKDGVAKETTVENALADSGKPPTGEHDDGRTANATQSKTNATTGDRLEFKLEEETETDILLARKRREANDVYFERVNNGVLDVVTKLEQVAVAMRAVEQESNEVWNENEA